MGHPMTPNAVTDDRTKQPKLDAAGNQRMETFVGVAIAKQGETSWNQTVWGAQIYQAAAEGWPNGEYNAPAFAWEIDDGDSVVPNKKGNRPCDRDGFPGHWVVKASTGFSIACYHKDRYEPAMAIQRKEEIKRGDYCRLFLSVKGNAPSESPGVYINVSMFELYQAGIEIVGENAPDASQFAASAAQLPAGALIDTNVAADVPGVAPVVGAVPGLAPPAAVVAPAPDFLNPPVPAAPVAAVPVVGAPAPGLVPPVAQVVRYLVEGVAYTSEQLTGFGWSAAQIAALPLVP